MSERFVGAIGESCVSVFLAELGDKTMLATAVMALRHNPVHVLAASLLAYSFANIVPVFAASSLVSLVSSYAWLLRVLAGALFVALGIASLFSRVRASECESLGATFTALLLSELGDKTQLATIAVALASGNPHATLIGGVLGYLAANAMSVLVSSRVSRRVSLDVLGKASGALFVALGIVVVLSALL
ncbi:TMEM165/GDT1 family protein [Infirmifilum lucidum]|uniref:TMEM165/GDT1 family protein n=1 Tax=Infirmifilum lucidum TaxID=2776706 RepID=A0A7L9FIN3_9CREN|nr:TMEM165/GDT1 family protein [Infirmifilum lucidum]QOJ78766.1 TMEM165/GDT1 family protein [Infirmifilum lucidum]